MIIKYMINVLFICTPCKDRQKEGIDGQKTRIRSKIIICESRIGMIKSLLRKGLVTFFFFSKSVTFWGKRVLVEKSNGGRSSGQLGKKSKKAGMIGREKTKGRVGGDEVREVMGSQMVWCLINVYSINQGIIWRVLSTAMGIFS